MLLLSNKKKNRKNLKVRVFESDDVSFVAARRQFQCIKIAGFPDSACISVETWHRVSLSLSHQFSSVAVEITYSCTSQPPPEGGYPKIRVVMTAEERPTPVTPRALETSIDFHRLASMFIATDNLSSCFLPLSLPPVDRPVNSLSAQVNLVAAGCGYSNI